MAPWSLPEGIRHARAVALAASLPLLWALAGALLPLSARLTDLQVVLFGVLPLLVLGGVLLALRPRAATVAGGVLVTLGLALAVAGHAAGPRGADLASLLPVAALVGAGVPPLGALALLALLLVALPLWAGARVHACRLALDATGHAPRSLRADLLTIPAQDAAELGAPASPGRWAAGALARLAEGWHLPGAMLALGARTLGGGARLRVHLDAPLPVLADALAEAGARVEQGEDELRVEIPGPSGEAPLVARVREARVAFPPQRADRVLEVRGSREAILRARRLLLSEPASHAGAFCWSAPGRRLERRVDALAREADEAVSVEERSVLLEEAERLVSVLARRDLAPHEWSVLQWKAHRLRARLASAMLGAPVAPKREERVTAPAPALAPELAHVMSAGGLARIGTLAYAPVWIVPVASPWGEREVVVDARTGRHDAADERALLLAMDERGPSPFLDVGRRAAFLPAPTPTASLLGALRESLPPALRAHAASVEAPFECLYVPFVVGDGGRVNAVTGAATPLEAAPRG